MIAAGMGSPSGPLGLSDVASHIGAAPFALGVDALLMVCAATYAVGVARQPPGDRRASPWRALSFLVGLLLAYVAVGSGLGAYSARPSVVVVQHVLLMMAAPPLLVLGRPVAAWTAWSSQRQLGCQHHGTTAGASRKRGPARLLAATVWIAYYGSMAAFFLTPLFPRSLHDGALLDGSEAWFAVVGLAFATYVVGGAGSAIADGTDPSAGDDARVGRPTYWARIVAVLAGAPVETAVGLALVLWPHPLAGGVTMATTHTAGLVLWAGGMLTSGLSLAYVLGLWCVDDTRHDAHLNLLLDAVAPPPAAGRALPVSAGDGPGPSRPGPG